MWRIILFVFLFFIGSFVYSKNIYINELKVLKNQFDSLSTQRKQYIEKIGLRNELIKYCYYQDLGKEILISPQCFLDNSLPSIGFYEAIDMAAPYIIGYTNSYELDTKVFAYENAGIKRKKGIVDINNIISNKDKALLLYFKNKNLNLVIPKIYFIVAQLDKYSIYASSKDLEGRNGCKKENYLKAIQALDKYIIGANSILNYNKILRTINNYCKSSNSRKYMFYDGVCGASTQLFRLSLINPYIKITKRYPHVYRHAAYYNEYVYGDDAAVYEMQKQFELKNISNNDIYLRILDIDSKPILFSFSPQKTNHVSYVVRSQVNDLQSFVGKAVFDKNKNEFWYEQVFRSKYLGKTRN